MLIAGLLQILAALLFVAGAWLLSGVGGAVMAGAVVLFVVGWALEARFGA